MRLLVAMVVVWLLICVLAVYQRSYFGGANRYAHVGTVAVTVLAGPLNYLGVNPEITCDVQLPQPSR